MNLATDRNQDDVELDIDVDLARNRVRGTIVEMRRIEIEDLFDHGRLVLWSDAAGWNGYETKGGRYYRVNYSRTAEKYCEYERVDPEDVVDAVVAHILDPEAGDKGQFERGCTPP